MTTQTPALSQAQTDAVQNVQAPAIANAISSSVISSNEFVFLL